MGESNKGRAGGRVSLSKRNLRYLGQLCGVSIAEEDLNEVGVRFGALLDEMEKLNQLDLSQVEPIPLFLPEEET